MGRTRGSVLPTEVHQLQQRIERWRRTRKRRTAMPAELWAAAVRLARGGRAWAVARALGINFQALRRRMAEAAGGTTHAEAPTAFVELTGAQMLATGGETARGSIVELSDRDGSRLTMRLPADVWFDVARIVAAFRRGQA